MRAAETPRADALLAALLLVSSGVDLAVTHDIPPDLIGPVAAATVVTCGAAAFRRRAPLAASIVFGVVVAGLGAASGEGHHAAGNFGSRLGEVMPLVALLAWILLGYSLGAHDERPVALLGLVALIVGVNSGGVLWDPSGMTFPVIGSVGTFVTGRAVGSRRVVVAQLERRALELEEEREAFAREMVVHERARIARELHDIVAHCVSVMVVQAAAGRRLAARDPALAAEALDHIAEAARQAEAEMGRLVDLLHSEPASAAVGIVPLVGELVNRAAATGLPVMCRIESTLDGLGVTATEAAYRVVQEALTNALKHAPGAEVSVTLREDIGGLEVVIVNSRPGAMPSGLEGVGGGRGLMGMRERVAAAGGSFDAGPTHAGGWRVAARFRAGLGMAG